VGWRWVSTSLVLCLFLGGQRSDWFGDTIFVSWVDYHVWKYVSDDGGVPISEAFDEGL
jgi:hypothetical protein